jgi:[ribosomal protein S5]-alanine N-acetyltransferase
VNSLFYKFEELDTGNYIVRKINQDDFKDIFDIYGDMDVMKYDTKNIIKYMEDAKESIEMINTGIKNKWFIRWGIENRCTGELIGTIALHHFDFCKNKVQIGYNLKKVYWKQNIMSEVLKSIINYLVESTYVKEIEASIHSDNIASIKLIDKLGFKLIEEVDNDILIFKNILN